MTRRPLICAAVLLLGACSRRPEVPILGYHSVSGASDGFSVTEAAFAEHLDALQRAGFHTVTFHEWLEHQDHGTPLPESPLLLTFDDGFEDAYATVLPALRARGMRGTFFVNTSLLGPDIAHRVVLNDGGLTRAYLVWPEVRALAAAGMEIGSHGVRHLRLPDLSREEAWEQIERSKRELEAGLGMPVEIFAYPYNSVRSRIESLVRQAGYRAAVAGRAHGSADRFSLYRSPMFTSVTVQAVLEEAAASRRQRSATRR